MNACMNCGRPVNPRLGWKQIVGYAQDRAQGGHNAVGLERWTGKLVCDTCMIERKALAAVGAPPPTPSFNLGNPDVRAAIRHTLDTFYPDDDPDRKAT